MTERQQFEIAMTGAGWRQVTGLAEILIGWRHRSGKEVADHFAFEHWKEHGEAPPPF